MATATGHRGLCERVAAGDAAALARAAAREPAAAAHWKPIMDAAFAGRADMVATLVEAGADPNVIAGTPARHTPLVRVIQPHLTIAKHAGHGETVAALLALGADPNLVAGPLGMAPLGYAAMGGFAGFADTLIDAGAKVGAHLAAALHDVPAAKRGIAAEGVDAEDARRRTPLHYLALSGLWRGADGSAPAIACLKVLLEAGADVNAAQPMDEGGETFHATPLWAAISWQGHHALARRLLEAGADPGPAVFAACFRGEAALLELLHAFGANWNQRFHGRTPLLDLMHYRKPGASIWLMEHGADVAATDAAGRTALHLAAMQGVRVDYLQALIAHGANPNARDAAGHTPLQLAEARNRRKVVAYLKDEAPRKGVSPHLTEPPC